MGGRQRGDDSGGGGGGGPSGRVDVSNEGADEGEEEWVWSAPAPPTEEEVRQSEALLGALEEYQPMLPDALMQQCLKRAGFTTTDKRVARMVAVAAQKFATDVASGALQACKVRQAREARESRQAAKGKKAEPESSGGGAEGQEKRYVMTVEDLSQSLGDYGINVRKRPYYADPPEHS